MRMYLIRKHIIVNINEQANIHYFTDVWDKRWDMLSKVLGMEDFLAYRNECILVANRNMEVHLLCCTYACSPQMCEYIASVCWLVDSSEHIYFHTGHLCISIVKMPLVSIATVTYTRCCFEVDRIMKIMD